MHNSHTIDPEIESRIIELRREHPDRRKKRIAQWIWKECVQYQVEYNNHQSSYKCIFINL